jgi:AraC-like DNA-binding protein
MSLHAALFALDSVAVFVLVLLAAGLLVSRPRSTAMRIAALILINTAGFVMFSRVMFSGWIPEAYQLHLPGAAVLVLQVMMNTTPGLFMLLCFFLFQDGSGRFPRWLLALFAVQVALEDLVPYLFGVTTRPSIGPVMTDTHAGWHFLFETLPALLQALFIGAAMYWTLLEWRADLVERRRRLRVLLLAITGLHIVFYTLLTRLVLAPELMAGLYVHEASVAVAVALCCGLIVGLLRAAPVDPAAQVLPAGAPSGEEPADLDFLAFQAAMKQRVYQEPGLTIGALASRLQVPEYRLRRLINSRLGFRNFNQMLHRYRVADAREALADPHKRDLPILSIALSLGYQSTNPFNRAFRDLTGTTPSAFREQALARAAAVQARGEDFRESEPSHQ